MIRDKDGRYIMIKKSGEIQQEVITLVNIYAPTTRTPKYIKQISVDIDAEIDRITGTVGDFNSPFGING